MRHQHNNNNNNKSFSIMTLCHRLIHFTLFATITTTTSSTLPAAAALTTGGTGNSIASKVIVTGAGGRTGKLVFSKLKNKTDVIGLVRTERSAKALMKDVKCGLSQLVVCDVTKKMDDVPQRLEGTDAMVICTSAVPAVSKYSIFKSLLKAPINVMSGKKAMNFRSLSFKYKPGQYPEKVDYEGQVNQIDLAKRLGIEHVVIVSSMGGTDPDNFLNSIGKKKDGTGNGDILLWKRKAEKYLINSGLRYTIIHPGGLRDTPGGIEQIHLDVDDVFLKRENKSISRADVANLCVAALTTATASSSGNDKTNSNGRRRSVSFDAISAPVEEGQTRVSSSDVLRRFMETGKTADYTL